ncbi:MAG: hypothetical protein ACXV9R_10335 [Methylobacter sp.]
MSTEIDLDNLLVLAKAATHGPWTSSESIGQKGHGFCAQVWKSNGDSLVYHEDISPQATADVEFIAAANPAVVEELVRRLIEYDKRILDLQKQLSDLQNREKLYLSGLDAVESLINNSQGVCGLHLNGDIAPWDELRSGGQFNWLSDFDTAMSAKEKS